MTRLDFLINCEPADALIRAVHYDNSHNLGVALVEKLKGTNILTRNSRFCFRLLSAAGLLAATALVRCVRIGLLSEYWRYYP